MLVQAGRAGGQAQADDTDNRVSRVESNERLSGHSRPSARRQASALRRIAIPHVRPNAQVERNSAFNSGIMNEVSLGCRRALLRSAWTRRFLNHDLGVAQAACISALMLAWTQEPSPLPGQGGDPRRQRSARSWSVSMSGDDVETLLNLIRGLGEPDYQLIIWSYRRLLQSAASALSDEPLHRTSK